MLSISLFKCSSNLFPFYKNNLFQRLLIIFNSELFFGNFFYSLNSKRIASEPVESASSNSIQERVYQIYNVHRSSNIEQEVVCILS